MSHYANGGQTKHPLPSGESAYAQAKRAELADLDMDMAKILYLEAIQQGDRKQSAIKDLASLLHREGSTAEAVMLLETYRAVFDDKTSVDNLIATFQQHERSSSTSGTRCLRVSNLVPNESVQSVRNLFKNPHRIVDITFHPRGLFAIVSFNSHSAARKTLTGLSRKSKHRIEWVRDDGTVACNIYEFRSRGLKRRVQQEQAEALLGRELYADLAC